MPLHRLALLFTHSFLKRTQHGKQLLNRQCQYLGGQRVTKEAVASPDGSRSRGRGHNRGSPNIRRWRRFLSLIQHSHSRSRHRGRGHGRDITNISSVLGIILTGRAGWIGAHVGEKIGYALSFSSPAQQHRTNGRNTESVFGRRRRSSWSFCVSYQTDLHTYLKAPD